MILAVLKGAVSVISQHVTKAFKESSMLSMPVQAIALKAFDGASH